MPCWGALWSEGWKSDEPKANFANADRSPRRYNLPTFIAPNLLLVEGPDEFQFFRFLRPRDDVQIHVYEGKNQLRLELETIQKVEGFEQVKQIAIVRDADNDPVAAVQSVLTQWSVATNQVVPKVASDEWFEDGEGRRWSVWIMPAPDSSGDLEELLWKAVAESDHCQCVEALMNCLDACNPIPFSSKTKARLYAWLATQQTPLHELHAALGGRAQLFDPANPIFARFATFVDSL